MDCQSDENKCDEIFGECRCYADLNSNEPKFNQVCGILKKGYVIPCKSGCCDGGCPGQCKGSIPREPYSFGYFNLPNVHDFIKLFRWLFIIIILLTLTSTVIVYRKRT